MEKKHDDKNLISALLQYKKFYHIYIHNFNIQYIHTPTVLKYLKNNIKIILPRKDNMSSSWKKLDTNVRGQGSFPCLWLCSILLGTDSFRVILWRRHIAFLLRFLMFFSLAAWRSPITVQSTPLSCTVPSNFLTNVLTNQLSLFLAQIQVLPRQLDMIEWFNILIIHLTVSNSSMGLMKWKWNE